jgi:histidine ammonia-lyase
VVDDVERILAIELLNAGQALDFRRPDRSSAAIEALHAELRKRVLFVENDVVMHDLMEAALSTLRGLADGS